MGSECSHCHTHYCCQSLHMGSVFSLSDTHYCCQSLLMGSDCCYRCQCHTHTIVANHFIIKWGQTAAIGVNVTHTHYCCNRFIWGQNADVSVTRTHYCCQSLHMGSECGCQCHMHTLLLPIASYGVRMLMSVSHAHTTVANHFIWGQNAAVSVTHTLLLLITSYGVRLLLSLSVSVHNNAES